MLNCAVNWSGKMSLEYMEKLAEIENLLNNPKSSDIEVLLIYIECLSTHFKYCRPFFEPHPRIKQAIMWAKLHVAQIKEEEEFP